MITSKRTATTRGLNTLMIMKITIINLKREETTLKPVKIMKSVNEVVSELLTVALLIKMTTFLTDLISLKRILTTDPSTSRDHGTTIDVNSSLVIVTMMLEGVLRSLISAMSHQAKDLLAEALVEAREAAVEVENVIIIPEMITINLAKILIIRGLSMVKIVMSSSSRLIITIALDTRVEVVETIVTT